MPLSTSKSSGNRAARAAPPPMLQFSLPTLSPPAAGATVRVPVIGQLPPTVGSFSLWTSVQAAWSILNAGKSHATEVAFDVVLSARNRPASATSPSASTLSPSAARHKAGRPSTGAAPPPKVGPVPMRVVVDREDSMSELLQQIQLQLLAGAPTPTAGPASTTFLRVPPGASNGQAVPSSPAFLSPHARKDSMSQLDTLTIIEPLPEEHNEAAGRLLNGSVSSNVASGKTYASMLTAQQVPAGLELSLTFDMDRIKTPQAQRSLKQLVHTIRQVCASGAEAAPIGTLGTACPHDLVDIWRWNSSLAPVRQRLLHDMVVDWVRRTPQAPAVCAWDGDLTYYELDQQSTRIATHLRTLGVGPNILVPLCFEKSKWTPVALLSIIKAGGACVMLDPTLPDERLRAIASQVKGPVVLASASNKDRASDFVKGATIIVPAHVLESLPMARPQNELSSVAPSNTLYVVFTSGSVGAPLGAIITHANFCSAVLNQQADNGIDKHSRVYDYASYSSDLTYSNNLRTIAVGGTICIPRQQERDNDLAGSVNRLRANSADLTTSVARQIHPADVPGIKSLIFSGEAISAQDTAYWKTCPELRNIYGPAECTTHAIIHKIDPSVPGPPPIGRGSGVSTWVVDRVTGLSLVAVGGIGELAIEGATVGQGYLNDEAKTAEAFMEDPPWLVKGGPTSAGRHGRVYKTGDLVRYNLDGSLVYMGRKDAQVTISGQRVELGDIEYHVHQALATKLECQVIADVITPEGSTEPLLCAFLSIGSDRMKRMAEDDTGQAYESLQTFFSGIKTALHGTIPAFMIPTLFLPIARIPLTSAGKTDRAKLRAAGPTMASNLLANSEAAQRLKREPSTNVERRLQKLWASILDIKSENISAEDSFLRIGGNSVTAVRLVGAARERGLDIRVASIFEHPRLSDLARFVTILSSSPKKAVVPFSLLNDDIEPEEARFEVASILDVEEDRIEDIFPCTPLQEDLFVLSMKRPEAYIDRIVLELEESVDIERFRFAWEDVVAASPNFRTYIVSLFDQDMVQAIVMENIHWFTNFSPTLLEPGSDRPIDLGTPLTRFALVHDRATGKRFFELTMHNAICDKWLLSLVLGQVESAYKQEKWSNPTPFQPVVQHLRNQNPESRMRFWKSQLEGCEAAIFPALPSKMYQPKPDGIYTHQISGVAWPKTDITAATAIRTALTVLIGLFTATNDVIFGARVTGRQAAIPGIERAAGPTLATVPMRVLMEDGISLQDLMSKVQMQAIRMIDYEQIGLARIRKIDSDLRSASQFQTLLVIQRAETDNIKNSTIFKSQKEMEGLNLGDTESSSCALELVCSILDNTLRIDFKFDPTILEVNQTRRIAYQMEHVLRQVCLPQNGNKRLGAIEWTGPRDIHDIWAWNATYRAPVERCVHQLFSDVVRRQHQAPAVCAWDGELTYESLDKQSTQLAYHLVSLGIDSESIVPIHSEKSKWMAVSILAVMKTGAASVTLDTSLPEDRLRSIVEQVNPTVIISSAKTEPRARRLASYATVVVPEKTPPKLRSKGTKLPKVHPSNKLYIAFTSGSTGTPKGAIITHSNFSSAAKYQRYRLMVDTSSRVYDFASYSFDVSWETYLFPLISGGCICIPRQEDCQNRFVESFNELKSNWVDLTPSFARSVDFSKLPELQTLLLGGEPLTANDAFRLKDLPNVINCYGPAECTISATITTVDGTRQGSLSIGQGAGLNTWIIDTETELPAVIGGIGELWLEGPLVGKGYLEDIEKTKLAFIEDPAWLLRGTSQVPGRRGRLYKTGDLVRYHSDGSLQFLGRKDAQINIAGHRIELGDVEYHVRQSLANDTECQLAAEMLVPKGRVGAMLVAFISLKTDARELTKEDHDDMIAKLVDGIEERLTERVPSYMIPAAFVPILEFPTLPSGKTDRRQLRKIGSSMTLDDLSALSSAKVAIRALSTNMERKIQALWANILGIDPEGIGADHSFFKLGGDSNTATRLVSAARDQDLSFTFADVFQHPLLHQLAQVAKASSGDKHALYEPCSLLQDGIEMEWAYRQAGELCNIRASLIQDIYPCTPLQEDLLALTIKLPGHYIKHYDFELQDDVDLDLFRAAWETVVAETPILRTRIVNLPGQGLAQVVISDPIRWLYTKDGSTTVEGEKMDYNTPLVRYRLDTRSDGKQHFVWTIHHALYDDWSVSIILENMEKVYRSQPTIPMAPFQPFVKHTMSLDQESKASYWRAQLTACEATVFPGLPRPDYQPKSDQMLERKVSNLAWPRTGHTPATVVRTAWALVMSRYTNSDDVVFGATASGRHVGVADIERLAGPTIAIVPVRITINRDNRVEDLLQQVQQQAIGMIEFEQTGLQQIRRIGDDVAQASEFQALLAMQGADEERDVKSTVFNLNKGSDGEIGDEDVNSPYGLLLDCYLGATGVDMNVYFDTAMISTAHVEGLMQQLEHTLRQLCRAPNGSQVVHAVDTISEQDLKRIWEMNGVAPPPIQSCIHQLMSSVAKTQPDKIAICAWDGDFTYAELDELSNNLAYHLVTIGVGPEVIVPLCFEKSRWAPVAIFGIMKAGGVCVLTDTSLPNERLNLIIGQVKATILLASVKSKDRAAQLIGNPRVVVPELLAATKPAVTELPTVMPSNTIYIAFTSGTTGVPKGVMVTHSNFASAVEHQNSIFKTTSDIRLYDFASYAFDASWSNNLRPLILGGTVCIPSDSDRQNAITESINRLEANCFVLTPSLGRTLNPDDLTTVTDLIFGGEQLLAEDIQYWKSVPRLFNCYGPAECTVLATACLMDKSQGGKPSIGVGAGAVPWILDVRTGASLSSFGSIGELLLEGPVVSVGYYNQHEKTNAVFIEDPAWLSRGCGPEFPGRRGRLYKTGDLARYNLDGSLDFMGRKDAQVKIRGQRVELDDIAHHVRASLAAKDDDFQVVADIITPAKRQTTVLAAFVGFDSGLESDINGAVKAMTKGVDERLAERVPVYMMPAVYIPLAQIPITTTGKLDRRKLREIGASMSLEELRGLTATETSREPTTQTELRLRSLWATVLDIDPSVIGADNSFFRIGGDSIAVMKLVGLAREQGLQLSAADIFKNPQLSNLAKVIKRSGNVKETIEPFSLLKSGMRIEPTRELTAKLCGLDVDSIEDIFPCTPLQEGLLALTAMSPGDYINRMVLELRDNIDVEQFREAIEGVVAKVQILRTRIVDLPEQGLVQVVIREKIDWTSDIPKGLGEGSAMPLGTPLIRFGLATKNRRTTTFYCTIHHALYDGWSLPLIFDQVEKAYSQEPGLTLVPFQGFIKHITSFDEERSKSYWKSQFDNSEAVIFPALPSKSYVPKADQRIEHKISDIKWPDIDVTPSNVLRAAWSILVARYTDSSDVVFGAVSSGRQTLVSGVELMAGPTITTVPVRVSLDWSMSVNAVMQRLQAQATDMVEYEQMGLARIRSLGAGLNQSTQFQSLVVAQLADEDQKESLFFKDIEHADDIEDIEAFNAYALLLGCEISSSGLRLILSYDSHVVETDYAKRLIQQLEHILRQLCVQSHGELQMSAINWTSQDDLTQIWNWNANVDTLVEKCVHDMIAEHAKSNPHAPAVCAWDGEWTYAELDVQSTRLASQLAKLGVKPGLNVPLCFEKSRWAPVAALGVMKAGGASVAIDMSLPDDRVNDLVSLVGARVIVTSVENEERIGGLEGDQIIVVPEKIGDEAKTPAPRPLSKVNPSDTLYIALTSGSTRTPKAVGISHANFASALEYQKEKLGLTSDIRVYDFISYAFDISWAITLDTLAVGGCVCIPSLQERQSRVESSITRYECTMAVLTPSLGRTLDPSAMPTLQVLIFGGEALLAEDVRRWKNIPRIINGYGPAECTVVATLADVSSNLVGNPTIGHGCGAVTWILDSQSEDMLASVGMIGELLLEGPLVGQGYLDDEELNATTFIEDPVWLSRGGPGHPGRRGRLFKTGDLVRYNSDGSLTYMGRKNAQAKKGTQRVELSEVEFHVRSNLVGQGTDCQVITDIVIPKESSNSVLVAFVCVGGMTDESHDALKSTVADLIVGLGDRLSDHLPQAMIPAAFIPIHSVPMTVTGKTDRRQLKKFGASITLQEMVPLGKQRAGAQSPSTAMEERLQKLWAAILGVDRDAIGANDTFVQAGGDSITAMRMVRAARDQGLSFTVADVFQHGQLSDLARELEQRVNTFTDAEPFSLVAHKAGVEAYLETAVRPYLHDAEADIEDVLPVTPYQQGTLTAGSLVEQRLAYHPYIDLPIGSDVAWVKECCVIFCNSVDILRTVFIRNKTEYLQVVLKEISPQVDDVRIHGDMDAACETFYAEDLRRYAPLGSSFLRFIITHSQTGHVRLTMRLPHSQYDGISLGLLLNVFSACYKKQQIPAVPRFASYLKHILDRREAGLVYWAKLLEGSDLSTLPPNQSSVVTDHTLEITKQVPAPRRIERVTDPVICSALCAAAIGKVLQTRDVVFGFTVSGRATLPSNLENSIGPCFNNIPIRVQLDKTGVDGAIPALKEQVANSMKYDTTWLKDIVQHCTEWPRSTDEWGFKLGFVNFGEDNSVDGVGKLSMPDRHGEIHSGLVDIMVAPSGKIWNFIVRANTKWYAKNVIVALADELAAQISAFT